MDYLEDSDFVFDELDFKHKVDVALVKAKTVLALGRDPELPEDVPHAYKDKV